MTAAVCGQRITPTTRRPRPVSSARRGPMPSLIPNTRPGPMPWPNLSAGNPHHRRVPSRRRQNPRAQPPTGRSTVTRRARRPLSGRRRRSRRRPPRRQPGPTIGRRRSQDRMPPAQMPPRRPRNSSGPLGFSARTPGATAHRVTRAKPDRCHQLPGRREGRPASSRSGRRRASSPALPPARHRGPRVREPAAPHNDRRGRTARLSICGASPRPVRLRRPGAGGVRCTR
jgi:hypothetical protein